MRQGTKSIESSHEKLVEMILRKVQSGGSFTNELSLQEHLMQLRHLYYEKNRQTNDDYEQFIQQVIEKKQKRIEEILDLHSKNEEIINKL